MAKTTRDSSQASLFDKPVTHKDYINEISDKAERRFFASPLSFAEVEENGAKKVNENIIDGYAAKFNKDSQDFGGWIERIAPGFFDDILEDEETVALFNHSMNQVLGRNKVNVKLIQDDIGLRYIVEMPDTTIAQDVRTLVKSKIINKSSFAFTVAEETFTKGDPSKGIPHVRTLIKGEKLYDVSPVTTPAYPDTTVAARSLKKEEAKEQIQASIKSFKSLQEVTYIIQRQKFNLKNLNKK